MHLKINVYMHVFILWQREALYCELLYTVIHQLGAQNKTEDLSPGDLFVYAQEVHFMSFME